MGNGRTPQRYFDQILLCVLDPLTDSVRNLAGLTDTETDQTVLITNNLKIRPPFTVLETRLMVTTLSSSSIEDASIFVAKSIYLLR